LLAITAKAGQEFHVFSPGSPLKRGRQFFSAPTILGDARSREILNADYHNGAPESVRDSYMSLKKVNG
jgi:hypothetical protein